MPVLTNGFGSQPADHWRDSIRSAWIHHGSRAEIDSVIEAFESFVSSRRKQRILQVVSERTDTIVSVFEEIHDAANFQAVLRTAESFGFHQVHIVRSAGAFVKNARGVSTGAARWMQIYSWHQPEPCLEQLRGMNYQIVAVSPAEEAVAPADVDWSVPSALVFGNERDGLSERVLDIADITCRLPMTGFTTSYNLSVSAALMFQTAYNQRLEFFGRNGDLSEDDQRTLIGHYLALSVRSPVQIFERLASRLRPPVNE